MRYVTFEEVLRINEAILGHTPEIRDAGLLASAVDRPAQIVFGADAYPTFSDKVAALMESICLNHAFVDGNKRTAVVAAMHMLNWNGCDLVVEQMELVDVTLNVVAHRLDREKLAEWIEVIPQDVVPRLGRTLDPARFDVTALIAGRGARGPVVRHPAAPTIPLSCLRPWA